MVDGKEYPAKRRQYILSSVSLSKPLHATSAEQHKSSENLCDNNTRHSTTTTEGSRDLSKRTHRTIPGRRPIACRPREGTSMIYTSGRLHNTGYRVAQYNSHNRQHEESTAPSRSRAVEQRVSHCPCESSSPACCACRTDASAVSPSGRPLVITGKVSGMRRLRGRDT